MTATPPPSSAQDGDFTVGASRAMAALLEVGRAVAEGREVGQILDLVAKEGVEVAGATSADILLWLNGRPKLIGSHGLSDEYKKLYEHPPAALVRRRGASSIAVETGTVVVVEDTERERQPAIFRNVAREEGYRSYINVPLIARGTTLGVFRLYRKRAGPWSEEDVELLRCLATQAANAVETARTLESRAAEVNALSRLVRAMREQNHEHANRLHVIGVLLALGQYDEAERFAASITSLHAASHAVVVEAIRHPALAALVLAETTVAQQRGITLVLDRRSRLNALPAQLPDAAAVTIVGNLVQNAFDAVAEVRRGRRRVRLGLFESVREMKVSVRDWGAGIPEGAEQQLFEPGFTTKPGHDGLGLALVLAAVEAANGTITWKRLAEGTQFDLRFPKP